MTITIYPAHGEASAKAQVDVLVHIDDADAPITATVSVPKALIDTLGEAAFIEHVRREFSKAFDRHCAEEAEIFMRGHGDLTPTGLIPHGGRTP